MPDLTMHLLREDARETCTIGRLYVDGQWQWFTLEDTLRPKGVKVPGQTCIPAGRYQVLMTMSNRFKRIMPQILNVPMFTGVRIHAGNTDADTEGCVLVGGSHKPNSDRIGDCAPALKAVETSIQNALLSGGKVWIEVVDPTPSLLSTTPEPDPVPDPSPNRVA